MQKKLDSELESIENALKSGRLKSVSCDEIVSKVNDIVEYTVRHTVRMVGISLSRVHYIVKNILNVRKISARWVPHLLTDDQMVEISRVKIAKQ